jgi:hypothetical protein
MMDGGGLVQVEADRAGLAAAMVERSGLFTARRIRMNITHIKRAMGK